MEENSAVMQCPGLVGTAPLDEVMHTATLTPFVEGGLPISLILISESGAGKSKTLLKYQGAHIHRTDDLTSKGLFDLMKADRENKIRYIMIPDFNPVLSHRASVTQLLIANLLTLSSEGTMNIADGRENKELEHKPCGIMTACTTQMFIRNHRRWAELGITRRFLPISYTYSIATISAAQKAIRENRINALLLKPITINHYHAPVDVSIPDELRVEIELLSKDLAHNLSQYHTIAFHKGERKVVVKQPIKSILPMSPHLTLQCFAKAHALYRRKDSVNDDDIKFLQGVVRFTDQASRVEL